MINDASVFACAPLAVMLLLAVGLSLKKCTPTQGWNIWRDAALLAFLFTLVSMGLVLTEPVTGWSALAAIGLQVSVLQSVMAILVQGLGVVVGRFSARYLEGEPQQRRYMVSLSMVLSCVHLLLLADHWLILIMAWSGIGLFLKKLLCFYEERPFALLASHKKSVADLMADGLLLLAALLSWVSVGSGSLTALLDHVALNGHSQLTEACAVLLVLAVGLRTALLPVHGWLIQVMEAPTPVSALLHAGVINLSGYVLIRLSPLFAQDTLANSLLLAMGLLTAVFAALVMFTRVSIKVRLAWSTVAQMGFMVVECALGLYSIAVVHLLGHSIYKAHAFLSASEVVSHTRVAQIAGRQRYALWSMWLAPLAAWLMVFAVQSLWPGPLWPSWWSAVLALAWSTLWWVPSLPAGARVQASSLLFGAGVTVLLTLTCALFHSLPLGVADQPRDWFAGEVVAAMSLLYVFSVLIQVMPARLGVLHRWVYAGLYLDEFYTRSILRMWPVAWGKSTHA